MCSVIVDDSHSNRTTFKSDGEGLPNWLFVKRRPHLIGAIQRRRVISRISDNPIIVQLNPNFKAFLTLVGKKNPIVCEWDEPPILKNESALKKLVNLVLNNWFVHRSDVRISCTQFLVSQIHDSAYLPHGEYLGRSSQNITRDFDFGYLGSLTAPWDHDLIFDGLIKAHREGFDPRVMIIGRGDQAEYWKSFCADNGLTNVWFAGYLPDAILTSTLERSKILLLPGRLTDLNRSRCSSKVLAYAQTTSLIVGHDVGDARYLLGEQFIALEPSLEIVNEALKLVVRADNYVKSRWIDHSYQSRAIRFVEIIQSKNLELKR
jgi:glycosyltransferase involved in cell wall biosynthesis